MKSGANILDTPQKPFGGFLSLVDDEIFFSCSARAIIHLLGSLKRAIGRSFF